MCKKLSIFIIHGLCSLLSACQSISADVINSKILEELEEHSIRSDTTEDPLIHDHLGDVFLIKAWKEYSLAYDINPQKSIREKLSVVQKKIPQEELYKQMISRSANNYIKLCSFRTGFVLDLNSKKVYISFSYTKNGSIKIDIPSSFIVGGISVFIKNGSTKFLPEGIEYKISRVLLDVISQMCSIFDDTFYEQFIGAEVVKNGKYFIYSKNGAKLTLNEDTALIEKISNNKLTIQILKYQNLAVSKIPSKIKFKISDLKIRGKFEATRALPI